MHGLGLYSRQTGSQLNVQPPLRVDMACFVASRLDGMPSGDQLVVGAGFLWQAFALGASVVEPVGQSANISGLLGHAREQGACRAFAALIVGADELVQGFPDWSAVIQPRVPVGCVLVGLQQAHLTAFGSQD